MKRPVLFSFLFFINTAAFLAADRADERWVERTLRSMTLEQKISQMLMARGGPGALRAFDSEDLKEVRRAITAG